MIVSPSKSNPNHFRSFGPRTRTSERTALESNKAVFSAEPVPIFRGNRENFTLKKIIFRSITVPGFWLVTDILVNGFVGLFDGVALGIEDVRAFPPMFGPVWTYAKQRAFRGEHTGKLFPFSLLGLLSKI